METWRRGNHLAAHRHADGSSASRRGHRLSTLPGRSARGLASPRRDSGEPAPQDLRRAAAPGGASRRARDEGGVTRRGLARGRGDRGGPPGLGRRAPRSARRRSGGATVHPDRPATRVPLHRTLGCRDGRPPGVAGSRDGWLAGGGRRRGRSRARAGPDRRVAGRGEKRPPQGGVHHGRSGDRENDPRRRRAPRAATRVRGRVQHRARPV